MRWTWPLNGRASNGQRKNGNGGGANGAGPDFLCVGIHKGGTTWLYQQLDSHPNFWMPPLKERTLIGNAPVAVERLMLTSLGAGLQVYGKWDTELDLVEWRHLATLGRDQFVRVVKKGFLFPLGHRAVEITITERKLAPRN